MSNPQSESPAGLLKWLQSTYSRCRRHAYVKRLQISELAPYPSALYKKLLSDLQLRKSVDIRPFYDSQSNHHSAARLFVRHDIDTAECIDKLEILLEIDLQLGIKPGIYVMADGEAYVLSQHRRLLASYREQGFEVGLHTVCYLDDDYLSTFKRETEHFTNTLGFSPSTFTVHGLGSFRFETRMSFCKDISGKLSEFGYSFTDCVPAMRKYEYVMHDSHWDEKKKSRFLYDDFIGHYPPFSPGKNYLLLTHPCYWV